MVVRRGKLPTSVCAEVEHVTTLWRLNGEDSEGENVEVSMFWKALPVPKPSFFFFSYNQLVKLQNLKQLCK